MPNVQHETATKSSIPIEFSFSSQVQPLQVELINNQPWFAATDVCEILDIQNPSARVKERLDDDEYLVYAVRRSGQEREILFVNESGLYNLIFQSRKPEAKKFRKWVTSEVLPSIRKTGSYGKPAPIRDTFLSSPTAFNELLEFCDSRQHEGYTWYAASTLRMMAGKQQRPLAAKLNELLQEKEAIKFGEDNQTRWYIRKDAIWKYINLKPKNLVNISIIKMLREGGAK